MYSKLTDRFRLSATFLNQKWFLSSLAETGNHVADLYLDQCMICSARLVLCIPDIKSERRPGTNDFLTLISATTKSFW